MNTVETYLNDLANGLLANTAISENGSINTNDETVVITAMNTALNKLFIRLPLSEKEVVILAKSHITRYILDSRYSLIHGDPSIRDRYIFDPVYKFENDVLKILSAYDDFGRTRTVNDKNNPFSVFTINPNTLSIPLVMDDEPISIHYQAAHPRLTSKTDTISLGSVALETPFLAYTAAQIYIGIGSPEAQQQAAIHLSTFETSINEMTSLGLYTDAEYSGHRNFRQKGWV